MLQTVCFEGRIRKPKINVPVIFMRESSPSPQECSGRKRVASRTPKPIFRMKGFIFSDRFPYRVVRKHSARPEERKDRPFRRLSHPPGWNRARQNRMSSRLRTHRTSNKFGPPHLSKNVRISPIIILLMNGKTISVPKTTCRPGPRRRPNCRRPANRRRL